MTLEHLCDIFPIREHQIVIGNLRPKALSCERPPALKAAENLTLFYIPLEKNFGHFFDINHLLIFLADNSKKKSTVNDPRSIVGALTFFSIPNGICKNFDIPTHFDYCHILNSRSTIEA